MRWPCIPRRAGAGGAQRLRALVAPESRSVIPIRRRWLCGPASAANPARLDAQLIPPPFLRCREKAESAPTLPPFAIPRCSSLQYQKMLPARWVREIAYNLLKPLGNSKAINWLSLLSMKISLQIENCREPGRRDRQTVLPVTASSATQSSQTGGPQKKNSVQRAPLGEPFLALRMCRRPSAARAGRPLLHDRSVLRQAKIADRICRRDHERQEAS